MSNSWVHTLRDLHDSNFDFDWDAHLRDLNIRLGRTDDPFSLPAAGLAPPWFVGDVEALRPRKWVLVVSLNQARKKADKPWHAAQQYTRQSYWDYWRFLHRNWWRSGFYRRLVRLSANLLDVAVDPATEAEFATTRMVFVELCPYSSRHFRLQQSALTTLAAEDRGFRLAAQVRRLLIEEATPALVLVNGVDALNDFERLTGEQVVLEERRYASVSRPGRTLWHKEGIYRARQGAVPVAGFPFLGKPLTHNGYPEVDQLGTMIRRFVNAM